jgi:acetyl-CoA carboxylase carboxyltransferase component
MTAPTVPSATEALDARAKQIRQGGAPKYHESAQAAGKLFARERIGMLLDADSFQEDGLFANCNAKDLPADGVVTGTGTIDGRPVAVMANDSTIKAGSWGQRTVEKIIRIQETAQKLRIPLLYLVDSAGARITGPGRNVSGAAWSRPHFFQSGSTFRRHSANLPAVWPVRGRWVLTFPPFVMW